MIIQGSNNPITITFDADISAIPVLVVSMWDDRERDEPVKVWEKADMTISGDTAICPITESETIAMPSRKMVIEAKGLDDEGNTLFWDEYPVNVKERRDKIIRLTQTGG